MGDLENLLRNAPERFRSIRLGVSYRLDWELARRAASKHPGNPAAAQSLAAWPEHGSVEIVYHGWYERPCRARIERYEPLDHLREISGASEQSFWQYFPTERNGYEAPSDKRVDPNTWLDFMTYTHEIVPASVLDPGRMWWEGRDDLEDPRLWEIGRVTHLDRPAIEAGARLVDWDSRTHWTELLWMADEYRLRIDAGTGILLRVACLVDDAEFVTTEVFDLAVDQAIDAGLFAYRPPPGTATTSGSR